MAARVLLLVQGVALLALALAMAILTLTQHPQALAAALFEVGAAGVAGAVLVLAAPRVATSVHWRSPVLLLNVLAIPVSISLAQSGQWWLAIPLGAMAVSAVVLLTRGKSFA